MHAPCSLRSEQIHAGALLRDRGIRCPEVPMSRITPFPTAVVLSPGVWRQFVGAATDNDSARQSAQRLTALLDSVLTSAPRTVQCPVELKCHSPQRGNTSPASVPPRLQLARITPRSGPAFLFIRLADEITVDIAAL